MTDIRTTYLFYMVLNIGEIQSLGKTPLGDRCVAVIEGGSFEGPKLKGTVLKGGSDWLISRPDGALQLDVRLTLKTDDGHLIGMIYRGYRYGPAAVIDRLNRGEKIESSELFPHCTFLRDFVGKIRLAQPHHRDWHWPPPALRTSL
jgi:hypothetical protein